MTNDKNALVVAIDETKAIAYFKDSEKFDELLTNIEETCQNFVADVETKSGRADIKSMAYRVTRTRTTLDGWGKKLNEEKRAEIEAVDSVRRGMRERLEKLQDQVRKPLNEWEEQEGVRIARIKSRLQLINEHARVDFSASSAMISDHLKELNDLNDWGEYDEFEEDALAKIEQGIKDQNEALTAAILREEQAQELAKVKAEMEEAQRAAAKAKAETERAEKEAAQAKADKEQAEKDAEEAKARAARIHEARERQAKAQQIVDAAKQEAAPSNQVNTIVQASDDAAKEEPEPEPVTEHHYQRLVEIAKEDKDAFNEAVSQLYHHYPSMGADSAKAILRSIYDGQIKHVSFIKKRDSLRP